MSPENAENQQTQTTAQSGSHLTAAKVREQIIENSSRKTWLYVWGVVTDWKHWEDEQEHLRADGALEALEHLAATLGLAEQVTGAAEEGRRRLRKQTEHCKKHGPARLAEIEEGLRNMMSVGPVDTPYDPTAYSGLHREKAELDDSIRIADDLLNYLDGEDIESG